MPLPSASRSVTYIPYHLTTTAPTVPAPPTKFILPDLVSHCKYPLLVNKFCDPVARASERWLLEGANHSERRAAKFMGLKAGELTAACYPEADEFGLRVCVDFMNWLFNMDDWLDEFDVEGTLGMRDCIMQAMKDPKRFRTDKAAGKLAQSFCSRMLATAGPGCYARFVHTIDLFFTAVEKQAADRANGVIPDLESYITIRADTSGCKPCFALHEYAADVDLPDEVAEHPVIKSLEDACNALVTWSNDIFSYNVEQSRNDTHNMIPVLMSQRGFTVQEAVDYVGSLCGQCIDRFESQRRELPSWGHEVDVAVDKYVMGLQHWIVGSLHWSFDSERYFGKKGLEIKMSRMVLLLPKQAFNTQGQLVVEETTPIRTQRTPIHTTPTQTTPTQMRTTPTQTTPTRTTPTQTTPTRRQRTPTQTTPIQATPIQTTPIQTAPTHQKSESVSTTSDYGQQPDSREEAFARVRVAKKASTPTLSRLAKRASIPSLPRLAKKASIPSLPKLMKKASIPSLRRKRSTPKLADKTNVIPAVPKVPAPPPRHDYLWKLERSLLNRWVQSQPRQPVPQAVAV